MMRSRTAKIAASIAALGLAGGATYKHQLEHGEEGIRRSLQFWNGIVPIYAKYRTVQLFHRDLGWISNEEAEKRYNELHEKHTNDVKDITYNLRGFYLKQAQIMSTQDDFVPKQYMVWVKDTQDNVPASLEGTAAREYARKVMKEEQGLDFDEVFSDWNDNPIGAASIGQVHKATLRASGQVVAVKLLLPGMESKFRNDIKTLKLFCQIAMPQHVTAFVEIEKQFVTEFDYAAEGKNLDKIRDLMLPKWEEYVDIPKPYLDLSSKHILTMSFLPGKKFVDGVRDTYSKLAELQGKSLKDLETERLEQLRNGTFVFKSIEEEKVFQNKLRNILWWNDLLKHNLVRYAYNYSPLRLFRGHWDYYKTDTPIDLGKTLEILCSIHGYQLFECGYFNGDCHPGNILLLPDGRLGLIDYGQVKSMSLENRIKYAKLMVAFAENNRDEVVRVHFDELGAKTKFRKADIAYKYATIYNDRFTPDVTEGKSLADIIDYLEKEDPIVQIPEDFIFASRITLLLRGMGNAFGLRIKMGHMWEGYSRALLETNNVHINSNRSGVIIPDNVNIDNSKNVAAGSGGSA